MFRVLFELKPDETLPVKGKLTGTMKLIVRKKTYGFEVDVATSSVSETVESINKTYGNVPLRVAKELSIISKPDLNDICNVLKESLVLFGEERFWESHVLLETVWRNSEKDMKAFLQSIILLTASQVHYQMGDMEVAEIQYQRAVLSLKSNRYSEFFNLSVSETFSYPARIGLTIPDNH